MRGRIGAGYFGRTLGSRNNLTATLVACVSRRDALRYCYLLAQVDSVCAPVHWSFGPGKIGPGGPFLPWKFWSGGPKLPVKMVRHWK